MENFVCRWWSFWQTQSDAYETAKCFFRSVNLHLPKIRTTNRALYRLTHKHQPNLPFTDSARDLVNQNCVFGFRVSEISFSSFPLVCNTKLTCADVAGTDGKWKCTLETIQSRPEMKMKICATSFPKNEKQILRKMLSLLIHETRSVFRMWKMKENFAVFTDFVRVKNRLLGSLNYFQTQCIEIRRSNTNVLIRSAISGLRRSWPRQQLKFFRWLA